MAKHLGSQGISFRAFGRRHGVSERAVRKARKNGRLERCILRAADGSEKIDPEVGDREWVENRDPSRVREGQKSRTTGRETGLGEAIGGVGNTTTAPPMPNAPQNGSSGHALTTADERRLLIQQQVIREELKNAILAGKYAPVEEYKRRETERVVRAKNRLLGLPSRAKQRLPHLTIADTAVLDELVREVLDELAARVGDDE